jgi:hypothetical protein
MTTPSLKRALKVGLVLAEPKIPAWFANTLEEISRDGIAEVQRVILLGKDYKATIGQPVLYSIFDRIDRSLFSRRCDPLVWKPLPLELNEKILNLAPQMVSDLKVNLSDRTAVEIRKLGMDVLLSVGVKLLPPGFGNLARYGDWDIIFGEDSETSRWMPGFREVVERQSVTLAFLTAQDGSQKLPEVLGTATWFTHPFSPARHRSYFFWAASALLPRALLRLRNLGFPQFVRSISENPKRIPRSSVESNNYGNFKVFVTYLELFARGLATGSRRLISREKWVLLVGSDRNNYPDFQHFEMMDPPRGSFWADPCLVERNSIPYIFFEEFDEHSKKGHISLLAGRGDGGWHQPQVILDKSFHLSYPFVFEVGPEIYMVPESAEAGRIDLYHCVQFPLRWEFHHTLIDHILARDTTLLFHEGMWWLFTAASSTRNQGANVELFLFFTQDLLGGKWTPHSQNPICSDIRRARPAGRIFSRSGKLYRPSQDCSKGYGSGFDINEIEVLSAVQYREKVFQSIRPDWDERIRGMHTISRTSRLCVVDALRSESFFQRKGRTSSQTGLSTTPIHQSMDRG